MRIGSFTIFNQITRALNHNLSIMSKFTNRLSTGKKINSPSEDVSGMMKSMDYKVSINEIEQYTKNIDEADSHLGFADTTMASVANSLTRARELALGASTSTQSLSSRAAIAQEISNLRDEISGFANSKFRNRYIFSGYRTDTQSFDAAFNYQGDAGQINVMIDRNETVAINVRGDQIFGSGATSIMSELDSLYNALLDVDPAVAQAGAQAAITNIEGALDQVANARADVGARMNRLDDYKSSLENRNYSIKAFLSETEDTDIAETVSELSKTEVALQSLRQSSVNVLSQSLMDFLG